MTINRAQIEATARGYVGTPFRHQGRTRGRACDCVGLVLCVAQDLGLEDVSGRPFARADYLNYGKQPVDAFVHDECCRRLVCLWPAGSLNDPVGVLKAGCVLTLRVPSIPCHVAIVTRLAASWGIVHAYSGADRVTENRLDEKWARRIAGVFDFPGIETGAGE